jgi:hypothetical protein
MRILTIYTCTLITDIHRLITPSDVVLITKGVWIQVHKISLEKQVMVITFDSDKPDGQSFGSEASDR